MNKIPKCNTRNSFTRNYLKLTKKLSVENRIMNRKIQKKLKSLNSSKPLSKENSAYSLISTKKTSTLTTTSSRNNSLITHKNSFKKISSNSTTINLIKKVHSVSRNKKIINNQNKKATNNNEINKLTINSKRGKTELDTYSKKFMNLSLNKLPGFARNKNKFKVFGLNQTYVCSPQLSLNNISITKIKKRAKNKINISKNTKNALLKKIQSISNNMNRNNRNRNNFNNRFMLNYFKNHDYSDYINNNIYKEESKNNNSNIDSCYLHLFGKQKKENLNHKNRINIYEENSKFINSRRIFKFKNAQVYLKYNTFDRDITKAKIINLKNNIKQINGNRNRNFYYTKILNQNKTINSTINENELYNRKEKYNILMNIKNKTNDDEKYLKFKKQIFEKAANKIQQKVGIVRDINSKIKKMKNLSKKFLLKKPFIAKAILKGSDENNKKNIKISNKIIEQDTKNNSLNNKNNSLENEKLNRSNKINIDRINIDLNISKRNKTISYKFNEKRTELEKDYQYFDISKIKANAQIPKEYLNIIYHNLLEEENKGIVPNPDYKKILSQKEINGQMRSILIDWIIDVHYKFGLTDETLFMTILIIDRYISYKQISKLRFQLLGITALLLSCKYEEIMLPKIEDFIYITDNAYVKKDVIDMERDILDVLNFDLIFPSPIKFYEYLALNFDFDKKKFLMGKYLMESFMVDLNWVKYRASVIACSCIYIVMKYYKLENYKEAYNKKYYNLNENDINNIKYQNEFDIKDCAKDICVFVDNVNKTNYLSCKNKYADENFEKVSLIISGEIS